MRLEKLTVRAFRGFARTHTFVFADVNIIGGPNGFGKTSLFDAPQWGLFGNIHRLSGSRDFTIAKDVCQNKLTAESSLVSLEINGDSQIAIERTATNCSVKCNGKSITLAECLTILGFAGLEGQSSFLRTSLLEQDRLAWFLRELNPRDRYNSFVSLLEFNTPQVITARSKAFQSESSGNRTNIQIQLGVLTDRIKQLQAEIDDLKRVESTTSFELIEQQYADAANQMSSTSAFDVPEGIQPIGERLNALAARIADQIDESRTELPVWRTFALLVNLPDPSRDIGTLESQLATLNSAVETTFATIKTIDQELVTIRGTLQQLTSSILQFETSQKRINSLLSELRELVRDDICPVCKRPIPKTTLLKTIDDEIGSLGKLLSAPLADRSIHEERKRVLEAERGRLELQLRGYEGQAVSLRLQLQEATNRETLRKQLLSSKVTLQQGLSIEAPAEAIGTLETKIATLEVLQHRVLDLAARFDQLKTTQLLPQKVEQLDEMQVQLRSTQDQDVLWTAAEQMFAKWIEATTRARTNVVEQVLDSHKPLIQSLYARFQAHPVFTEIDFEVRRAYGDAELFICAFPKNRNPIVYPSTVFSTSQLNVLAICIFLVLNIRSSPSFEVMMLDDPIQSMDDLNLLGFCDVIRQLKGKRQLFISTHNRDFYGLLMNKLRPVTERETLKGFWFHGWSKDGPIIEEQAVTYVPNVVDLKRLQTSSTG